jgi:selenocysteine-specific elongation factor
MAQQHYKTPFQKALLQFIMEPDSFLAMLKWVMMEMMRIEAVFRRARFAAPLEEDVRRRLGLNPSAFKNILDALIREGRIVRLGAKVTYHREALDAARDAALGLIERHGCVTIAELRDRLNLSRKYAQAILEHFDKTGLTKRVEDRHVPAVKA